MKESEFLHVGDPVWWRGSWGVDEPKLAEIEGIETNASTITNNGIPVEKLPWREVRKRDSMKCCTGEELAPAIVNLTNGHWAMGYQLWPLKIWAKSYDDEI